MDKILIINTKYRNFGGEDSNILDEIEFLSSYYKVNYLEFDNSEKLSIFDFFYLLINSNLKSNRRLKKYLNNNTPDLVYVHNLWFRGNLGLLKILEKSNIKFVQKIHNYRLICSSTYLIKNHIPKLGFCNACNLKRKKFQIFNKYFTSSYFKSIFVIHNSKKYLKLQKKFNIKLLLLNSFQRDEFIKKGISENDVDIFYNPLTSKSIISKKYNSKSNYVVYGGLVSQSKGIDELIEAWKVANLNNLELKIIGKLEDFRGNFKELESYNIFFLGQLSHLDLLGFLENSRALVTATKLFEGQPKILCEASLLSIPSIYPSFGGMDEYFPESYYYSFEQFNYSDLIKKLKFLNNIEILEVESKRVNEFITSKLNKDNLMSKFQSIIHNIQ